MTIGNDRRPPAPEYRAWAAEQLGLSPEATADDARRALLSRLRDDEFVPPRATQTAWRMLVAGAAPDEEAKLLRSDKVRADIDAFAASFFDLPILERKRRWHALMVEADGLPARTARLQALAPGLNVDHNALPDEPQARAVAEEVIREFLVPPVERAARRQAWQAELVGDTSAMQAAAASLKVSHPDVAKLVPELIEPLAAWKKRAADRNRNLARASNQQPTKVVKEKTGSSACVVWVIIGVLSAAVRLGTSSSNRTTPSYKPLPQTLRTIPTESWQGPQREAIPGEAFRRILEGARRQQEQLERQNGVRPRASSTRVPLPPDPRPIDPTQRIPLPPLPSPGPSPAPHGRP